MRRRARRRGCRRCGGAGRSTSASTPLPTKPAQVSAATGGRPSSARSALPVAQSVGLESISVPSRSKIRRAIRAPSRKQTTRSASAKPQARCAARARRGCRSARRSRARRARGRGRTSASDVRDEQRGRRRARRAAGATQIASRKATGRPVAAVGVGAEARARRSRGPRRRAGRPRRAPRPRPWPARCADVGEERVARLLRRESAWAQSAQSIEVVGAELADRERHAAFHLIEQPIAGICSRGPCPVAATSFIASKSSRRAPGCGLGAAVVEPAAVLQLELGVEAEEVRGAGGAVGARGGLVDVVQVGEGEVVLAREGAHLLEAVLGLGDRRRSSRSRRRRSRCRAAPCRRGRSCRPPPARRGSGCR